MPGQQDLWPWLQSIMQNQGAGQPMNPNAIPAAAPQAMPGSGVNGMPAMTQGGPSMGFPAMGQPGAQPQPSAPQPPAPGQNPPLFQFGGFHPGNIVSPDFWHDLAVTKSKLGGLFGSGQSAAAAPSPLGSSVTAGDPSDIINGPGGISSFPSRPNSPYGTGVYPASAGQPPFESGFPGTGAPAGSPSATPRPVGSGPKGPLASPTNTATPMKRTAGAANLGYYQPSNRFIGIDQPNASAQNSMRAGPQATALNLGGLFGGRGQQPAANPANVPAANAQPVSAVANGPTPYGPDIPRLNPSGNLALTGGNSPGPNQFSSVPVPLPPAMPGGIRNQRVANAVRNPNWWQNL